MTTPGGGRWLGRCLLTLASEGDRAAARSFAAAVPVAYWAPFLLAPLVPGTAVDDPPHPVPRLAGVPINLPGAAATTATATAGWFIDRRSPPRPGRADLPGPVT